MRGITIFYRLAAVVGILIGAVSSAAAQETLTWENCLSEAAKNHPNLISAKEAITGQKAAADITASGLYPQIKATGGATTDKNRIDETGTTTKSDSYSYGVSATQLLFDGFKNSNDKNSGLENVKAAQQNYRYTSANVRLSLRTAFVNLLKSQELVRVAEEIEKIRSDSLELITLRYQSGLEHKGAFLTARANLTKAKFELAQAIRDITLGQRQLAKEMGRTIFKPFSVQGEMAVREAAGEKPDLEALVKNNPSLLKSIAEKNAARFNVKSARAGFSPEVSLQSSAGRSGDDWSPQDEQWSAGVSVSVPLFEGGSQQAQVTRARAAFNQAQADERDVKDTLLVSLEQSWVSLQDAIGSVDVQRELLEAAQERSKIAEVQYSTGFITFDSWIIIENDLVSAKKSYLEAQAAALYAEAAWIQAKGETLEYVESEQ
ncbi:MAG: TolC family protein [Candidatus Omnitrophica bacterium]|nr:TolC family protein [Candidatus Omnitrophota bacterium]